MRRFIKAFHSTLAFLVVVLSLVTLSTRQDVSAYEDSDCLVCHKDYGRSAETIPENVSSLYVNQEEWEKDVHFEVVGLVCDDCHSDATPETHPEKGLQKVDCGECHEEVVDSYHQTAHYTSEVSEGRRKPDCADCHHPHATRTKDDPEASVYKGNIKSLCLPAIRREHLRMNCSTGWLCLEFQPTENLISPTGSILPSVSIATIPRQ